jgi:uncharacterized membrane-anchored protein
MGERNMIVIRIIVLTALLSAALGYMIVDRASILSSDQVVVLKVKPVDPSDMFRGDYVILTYDISQLDTATLEGDDSFRDGEHAYVTLTNQNGVWTPTAVNRAMPAHAPGAVVLRGDVASRGGSTLRVNYGIESFFVPQGQGKPIEDERQKGDVTAEIAVDTQGRGVIKSLRRANGDVLYVESLF